MQDENETFRNFFGRTEALALKLGVNVQDLPGIIGIGRASLFSYRTGNRPITGKVWLKLEAAERAAGIGAESPNGTHVFHLPATPKSDSQLEQVQAKLGQMESELARLTAAVEALVKRTSSSSDHGQEAAAKKLA